LTKNAQRALKFKAIAAARDFYEHDFRADYQYRFQPQTLQDRDFSSPLSGPAMKTLQWDPTATASESERE
jgi:hypothetical protein